MDSPTSKLFFLSSMLRTSKDHRSAGLWWSLLLSGVSLVGHGSFLSLLHSCFVFPITSLFWSYLPWLLGNEKNQTSLAIIALWDLFIILGKCSLYLPWAPWWKEREKKVTWVSFFPHFLEFSREFPSLFWIILTSSTLWHQMWIWGKWACLVLRLG